MKVLSLFDGMACGMLAFQRADITVERYVAYEIDKYAVQVSSHNFPMIEQRGDVFKADFTEFEGFDFVVGGSPCTYWSIAQKKEVRETEAHGIGWELFQQYVRAIKEAKPKYFIYENNKSMAPAIKSEISEAFGFDPIMINSSLVSAQNRQRYYWVGIRNEDGTYRQAPIEQPEDLGIMLKDVLDDGWITDKDKSHAIIGSIARTTHREYFQKSQGQMVAEPIRVGSLPRPNGELSTSQAMRVYSDEGKGVGLKACGGGMGGKTGLYAVPICHTIPQPVTVRKYTCDIEKLKSLLRDHKKLSNKEIALATGKPQTLVEHWFRKDEYFAVPDADIWFDLKKMLGIETTEFDDFVMVFETRDGVFDKAKRCYDPNGKMSTVMTGSNDNVIVPNNGKADPIYEVKDGMISIKDKQYPIKLEDGLYTIRKLTVAECKRLQTVPEDYDMTVISDTQAYKCLGNGWTVDVIAHLIKGAMGN